MSQSIRKIQRLARDNRASLPVELTIILPLVFALVFGVIDVSRVLLARSLVDHLAVSLSEQIKFEGGSPATQAAAQAKLVTAAPNLVGGLVDVSRLSVTVSNFGSLADFVDDSPSADGPLTAYRLDYVVTLITPFVNYLYSSADVTESALVLVKNGA
ncbi:TadE/TadG family type IV pilus assembly protein [Sneathiella sp.]|uniref:TadE/TadG family type IV pilus assembly protein n=1 Tax=Sneathiella sp. TaxID=1964365 RepID=UPI00262B2DCA|nr:TadE/TadG family type IV pilus assembly protein [Sneathiella sp.]MDF2367191.1 TadE/TadG family type IV pilus assembly protein [Sneathiella sp.]